VVYVRSTYYLLGFNAVWSVESEQALFCLAFAFSLGLFFDPEARGDMCLRRLTLSSFISQHIVLFITTAGRTSYALGCVLLLCLYSPLLGLGIFFFFFSFLILYTIRSALWTGGNKHRINTQTSSTSSGVRTHGPSVGAGKDNSCLRPHGQFHQHVLVLAYSNEAVSLWMSWVITAIKAYLYLTGILPQTSFWVPDCYWLVTLEVFGGECEDCSFRGCDVKFVTTRGYISEDSYSVQRSPCRYETWRTSESRHWGQTLWQFS
jgi:hypothetical protein